MNLFNSVKLHPMNVINIKINDVISKIKNIEKRKNKNKIPLKWSTLFQFLDINLTLGGKIHLISILFHLSLSILD